MASRGSKADQWETERRNNCEALRAENKLPTTPFPERLDSPARWLEITWPNVTKFNPEGYSKEDVPTQKAFRDAKVYKANKLHGYLLFKINEAQSKKRTAEREAERERKRLRNERPLDKSLFGDDVEAWEAAMKKAAWDNDKKRVVLGLEKFVNRGGSPAFWYKLKDDERAAKVLAAKVAEALRRSTRVRRPTKHYDPAAAAEQTGASPEDSKYPHLGVEEDETVCRIILGEGGEEALKALGVDWVCGAWQSETSLELKLRGLMEQLSRILTIGAVTTKVHCDQALAALERELDKRLAAWYATLPKARVPALGEATNRGDASSPPPPACAAASAADGADVRVDAAPRFATSTACGGAASALGDAAETPSMEVRLAAARQRGLDLVRLVLDANEDVRTGAARFAGDASDASTAARSADRLTSIARRASPDLKNKHAICDALDGLPLRDTQFGLLGLTLLRAGFVAFDPTTGKAVDGAPIQRMRARVAGLPVGEKGRGAKFHRHEVVLVAVQLAFANKLLDFKRMRLSLFQCVFGRYLLALWAWLNGLTLTDFLEMGLDPKMVAVEVEEDEVKLLPPAVAVAFAGGVKFDTADALLEVHQNANKLFAAGKNSVFEDGRATYIDGAAGIVSTLLAAGADATGSAAARGSVAMDIDDAPPLSAGALRTFALAADAVAACYAPVRDDGNGHSRKLLASFCAGALESPARDSVLGRVDAVLADGGASCLAAATRIVAGAASRVDLAAFRDVVIYVPPPPEMTFPCEIQFHTNTVDGWLDSRRIDDFFAVYSALKVHKTWGCEPAWVLESRTCLAFQTSGQQILAGMDLEEFTAPSSICAVFDY